jgi:hypothetical protein
MPRYELPPDLSPRERNAVVAALDDYFSRASVRPSPWALSGRAEALGLGALQIRHQSLGPWGEIRLNPYTRLGTETRMGRGDAK